MKLSELYREVIMDHHRNPRGREPLTRTGVASHGHNPTCGDEVDVALDVRGDQIAGICIQGQGCSISTAAGSMLAEIAQGRTIDELKSLAAAYRQMLKTGVEPDEIDLGDLVTLAGVSQFPVRVKCAMLPVATALEAIADLALS